MPAPRLCAECGASLPSDAPDGLCPTCGFQAALKVDPQPTAPFHPFALFDADRGCPQPQQSLSATGEPFSGVPPAAGPDASEDTFIRDIVRKIELAQPAAGADTHTPHPAFRRFGDYELLEEIARGGMGVVYRARQISLNRTVAVKMILVGQLASAADVKRFRAEAEAAANLQHPNIVAIHEVGEHDGQHYFSMDYVEGRNLAEWSSEFKVPSSEFERRVEIVKTVAEAIHYAHQRGILHRDLKPSNVLIDANDQPRITDFGLAKRLANSELGTRNSKLTVSGLANSELETPNSELTLSGQVLGSPNFMPPEQATGKRGQVGPQSDVYSLGAILYHLLTARPPVLAETLAETLQQVQHTDPISPRLLNPAVPRDLQTICLKCLEKEPRQRYATAQALAGDLGRFLEDKPILARPASALYRFQKTIRRHRLTFAAAAAVAIALVVGVIISTWQAARATRAEALVKQRVIEVTAERDQKDKARQAAEAARQAAEAARQEAEAISTFLTEVFQSPDPKRDGRSITVAETLDAAAKKLDTNLANQPERRAKLQTTLGFTYRALGLDRDAITQFEKARDYYLATHGPEHSDTVRAMHNLAISYDKAGRLDEALTLQEEVLALRRKALGPVHTETLRAMNNLAGSLQIAGRFEEALKLLEEVLALRREALGPEHPETLSAMDNLANCYHHTGRQDEALKLLEEELPLCRKVLGPEHPDTLMAMNNLAIAYHAAGRREEALRLREDVLALCRKVLGPEHPTTLDAMDNLANSYHSSGRLDEALKLLEEVLPLCRKVFGPEHPGTLDAMNNLAIAYDTAGRRDEALKLQEEVLPLRCKVSGPEHPHTLGAMSNLALYYQAAGRWGEAFEMRKTLLALRRKVLGPDHPDTLDSLQQLAEFHNGEQRYAEAEPLYRQILQSQTRRYPSTNDTVVSAASALARLLHDWALSERGAADKTAAVERAREAERLLRDCVATRANTLRPGSSRLADTRIRLGDTLVVIAVIDSTMTVEARLVNFTEAESLLLKGHDALRQNETVEPKYKRDALERLVRLYEAWNKPEQLAEWKKKLEDLSAEAEQVSSRHSAK